MEFFTSNGCTIIAKMKRDNDWWYNTSVLNTYCIISRLSLFIFAMMVYPFVVKKSMSNCIRNYRIVTINRSSLSSIAIIVHPFVVKKSMSNCIQNWQFFMELFTTNGCIIIAKLEKDERLMITIRFFWIQLLMEFFNANGCHHYCKDKERWIIDDTIR